MSAPFKNIDRLIRMYHLAGSIEVRPWKKIGIFSIGNMNPDKRRDGSNPVIIDICIASCWFFAKIEMSIPCARQLIRNIMLVKMKVIRLPLNGISKTIKETISTNTKAKIPIIK